jgi:hypothetical protein
LGTLFGKTIKVDMKFTREKGVLRILVGCLDFRRIPTKERIFIADGFYDISFKVEVQSDLEMTTAVNLGEDPSDNNGHGNNGDSASEPQKNHDAMETDVAHNLQDQEGSKNAASNGPDINKLAGYFSSGVKFSRRVKLMMEQSRIELSAFINSMSSSAAMAEDSQVVAAATPPAAQTASSAVNAARAGECTAANLHAVVDMLAAFYDMSAAGAGDCPAVMPRASSAVSFPSAAPMAAEAAVKSLAPVTSATNDAAVGNDMVISRSVGAVPATPTKNSFHVSTESSEAILRGPKTPASPIISAKGAAHLSPSKTDDGCGSRETTETAPFGCEKSAPLGKGTPWIAAASFSP